jgi:hypothetical protein
MQRPLNLVIGLAIVVAISIILFGAIGGKGGSRRDPPPASTEGPIGGLPQLDMATSIVGPSSSQPPPIPSTAHFTPPRRNDRLEAIFADPAPTVDARWERARQRLRRVFGGALSTEKEAAVQAAVATWVGMQVTSEAAYHRGYIDARMRGIHAGWNRNVYLLALQEALGNADYQRYAGGEEALEEIAGL